VRRINRWFIHRKLETQIDHRNNWYSIFYNPFDVHLVKRIKKCRKIIFDWTDDWPNYYQNAALRSSQNLAIKMSSNVIAVNENLRDRAIQIKGSDQNVLFLPNATSFRPKKNFPLPEEISCIPKPRVGFIGHIGPWFDIKLVREIARVMPNLHWVLIGKVDSNKKIKLENIGNIHLLGQKTYLDLQSYIAHCQILVAPYIDRFEGDSTKLYDYLTVGLPIISSNIQTACRLSSHVKIATTLESWLANFDSALSEDDISLQQARKNESLKHNWDARATTFLNWINDTSN
jgi:glycosyltransferase involved in cell wall biosynthesis